MIVLAANDVGVSYGNRVVLEGFTATVEAGEQWALTG